MDGHCDLAKPLDVLRGSSSDEPDRRCIGLKLERMQRDRLFEAVRSGWGEARFRKLRNDEIFGLPVSRGAGFSSLHVVVRQRFCIGPPAPCCRIRLSRKKREGQEQER
jgi:hypothetical protein